MEWIVIAALAVLLGGLGLVLRDVAAHNPKVAPSPTLPLKGQTFGRGGALMADTEQRRYPEPKQRELSDEKIGTGK